MAANQVEIRVVASGAEAAAKVLQSVAQAGGQIGSITASGAKQAETALRSLGGTAKEVFTIFTGFTLGNLFVQGIESIKAFATETAKLGLEAKVQEDAFARLSQSVGVAGDALVAEMQKAAGGILNTSDVMIAAAKALNQSLQPDQIVNLMTIARQQSKLAGIDVSEAFNLITQAIANQQPRALKQLGIVVDMDAAFKKHAATLGVEVAQLNELGKTQAIYNAVAEQTKNSVKALTDEGLSQSEMVQKLAGQWKQAQEDIGKFVVDAGFAVLAWLTDVSRRIPDLTAATQQMGQIWSGVWGNLKTSLAGLGENLVSVIIPSLKLALAAAAAFGVGLNAAFTATAGPAAFLASIIGDLAAKKWPDFTRATLEANVATAEARVRLAESIDGFQKLKDGTAAASTATKDMAGAAGMGTNKLADAGNQVKALLPDLKALQGAVAGVASAFKALSDEAARGVFPEDALTKLNAPLDAMRDKMREQLAALGLNKDAIQKVDAALAVYQASLVRTVQAHREAKEEADAFYTNLPGQIQAAADSYNAMRGAATAALEAIIPEEIAEATEFYRKLAENITAGAKAVESIQTPLDDAARATQTFEDSLQRISVMSQLLGPNFDATGATISRMQQRLQDLAATAQGEVTPEMVALGNAITGMIDQARMDEALGLTRTTFDGMVDMARDTARSMSSAMSDLFFNAFTGNLKSAADVFKSFALSMLRTISNFLAERVTQQFLAMMFGGGGGGGGVMSGGVGGGGTRVLPDGTTVSVGVSSPAMLSAAGMSGGGGFDWSGASNTVGGFITGLQGATNTTGTFSAVLSGISSGWNSGFGGVVGAVEGGWSALSTAASSASALTVALAGVGAAVAAFGSIMDIAGGKVETGVGGLVGGAIGAAGGAVLGALIGAPWLGGFIGYVVGDLIGSWIGSLFGGPSNYELKRTKAAQGAQEEIQGLTTGFQAAARTGSAEDVLATLRRQGTGVSPLRTELSIPPALAEQLGLMAVAEIQNGQAIVAWADVTQAQFNQLIELFKADPSMIARSVRGAGDIGYLSADKVKPYTDALAQGATALLTAFSALEGVRDQINGLAADILSAAKAVMPEEMATQLAEWIVNPIRDQMLAVIQTDLPVEEMSAELEKLSAILQSKSESWGRFADAAKALPLVEALVPADLADRMHGAIQPAYDKVLDAMRTGTAEQAKLAVDAFEVLTKSWAAFSQSLAQKSLLEDMLPADLGARFREVMEPAYTEIVDTLTSGNGRAAAAEIQAFNQRLSLFAGLAQAKTQAIDVDALLPDNLAERFRAVMGPQWDKILSDIATNADLAALELEKFNKALAAWASVGQTVMKITGEIGALTSDPTAGIAAWQAVQAQMDRMVDRAKVAFDAAISSGDVERIAATSIAYHDAVLQRLQAETQMVQKIMEAIAATLQLAETLVQTVAQIAILDIGGGGGFGTLTSLLGALQGMAETGATAAERMWAVGQALSAIIAVLPSAIKAFGPMQNAADWLATGPLSADVLQVAPNMISRAVVTGAAPFLAALQAEIDAATGGAKLGLLQQQAAGFTALANAAIAGVNQWAQQAIAGAQAAGQAVIDGLEAQKAAALEAIDVQIAGIQEAAEAAAEARRTEMEALQAAIQSAREWEAAIKSMGDYILALQLGPAAPINPLDQLTMAQDAYATALAAYTANPTAAGLADVQRLAQAVLTAAQGVYTKPSPEYQALFAGIVAQLKAANVLAQAQAPDDSTVLQAQLTALQALDRTASQAASDQIAALNDQKAIITREADKQIAAVRAAVVEQVTAIKAAADAEIAGINAGLSAALAKNAADQAPLIAAQLTQQEALLAAVTRGAGNGVIDGVAYLAGLEQQTVTILGDILKAINAATGHQAGAWETTAGLARLHEGEMVVPRAPATALRRVLAGGGPTATGGAAAPITLNIVIHGATDPEAVGRCVRREIEQSLRYGRGARLIAGSPA